MRVIRVSDLVGAARDFAGNCDGLSFDNWDSIPIADLDDVLEGCGITKFPTEANPDSVAKDRAEHPGIVAPTPRKRKAFRGGVCLAKGG